ncbi:MAG: hypothetical protein A3G41_02530 [Elusimicrobia bacterium RIFCSPLOWO2_12_FULL_59_9]|nr:MAG: hypothetical protein A3G41_02530 [Elusimicrobia bacterium RIFCSPLOWO2_12_FULL_59_9]
MSPGAPGAVTAETVQEAVDLLKELVALDTTNPPGDEIKAVEHIKPLLERDGAEVRVFESAPKRGNLWARVKGRGSAKPFLITAHLDVVGAKKEGWESDPFKAEERGGYLYGRGVLDDKAMAAAGVTVLRLLARSMAPLERDVVLFLSADEEAGSGQGMAWMLKNHPELLEAEAVLNEGGRIVIENGRITHAAVQNYEKLYLDVALSAEGPSGHSSMPRPGDAITRLSRAVARVGAYEFPVRLNQVTRAYFSGLSRLPAHPLGKEFSMLVSRKRGPAFREAVRKITSDPAYNAGLRTTCAPTVVQAGFRSNAIPSSARADVNCRVLPNDDPRKIVEKLREVIGDPAVKVSAGQAEKPALSPEDHPFFRCVRSVLGEMAPGAVTAPYMSAGATDSRELRRRGLNAYGLAPFPVTLGDEGRMHGDNERLMLSSVSFGLEFLYRLTVRFAAAPVPSDALRGP